MGSPPPPPHCRHPHHHLLYRRRRCLIHLLLRSLSRHYHHHSHLTLPPPLHFHLTTSTPHSSSSPMKSPFWILLLPRSSAAMPSPSLKKLAFLPSFFFEALLLLLNSASLSPSSALHLNELLFLLYCSKALLVDCFAGSRVHLLFQSESIANDFDELTLDILPPPRHPPFDGCADCRRHQGSRLSGPLPSPSSDYNLDPKSVIDSIPLFTLSKSSLSPSSIYLSAFHFADELRYLPTYRMPSTHLPLLLLPFSSVSFVASAI